MRPRPICSLILYSLALILALAGGLSTLRAEDKTAQTYLDAYQDYMRAEQLERNGKSAEALEKYKEIVKILHGVRQAAPDWQSAIVQFRLGLAQSKVERLEGEKSAPTVAVSPQESLEGPLPTADTPRPVTQEPSIAVTPSVTVNTQNDSGEDSSPTNSNQARSQAKQIQALKSQVRELKEQILQETARKQSALVAVDRGKVSSIEMKAQITQLREELDNIRKDATAKTSEKEKGNEKIAKELANLNELYRKSVVEFDVLEETYQSNLTKLERAAKYIGSMDEQKEALVKDRDTLIKEKNVVLKEKAEALQEKAAAIQKLKNIKDNAKEVDRLVTENKTLNEKLTSTTEKLTSATKKLKTFEDSTKELDRLSTENKALSNKLSEAEKKITELANIGPEKDKVISDIQSELNGVKDQLVAAQTQLQKKDTRITDLEKQLDETAGELASLRLNPAPSVEEKHLHEENDLLRGIVLRQLKDQARRAQVRKLIEDEVQRLQVKSTTLEEQLGALGNEALLQTDEEKALFKTPQVILMDSSDQSVNASVAISKSNASPLPETSSDPSASASPNASPEKKENAAANQPTGPEALPSDLEPLIQQAKDLFSRGNFAEADKVYVKILEAAPDNYYALANYGVTEFQLGRLAAAEVALRKAASLSTKDSFAYTILGIVHFRQGRYDEAITMLNKAIEINPKDFAAHNYLGISLSNKGDRAGAEQEIIKAIKIKPDYADAHFNLAVIYITDQPPSKDLAKREYTKAVQLGANPDASLERMLQITTPVAPSTPGSSPSPATDTPAATPDSAKSDVVN
ncbi:MAG: tetratricopeptide repeat protein [Chthoniobacterales bacterium]